MKNTPLPNPRHDGPLPALVTDGLMDPRTTAALLVVSVPTLSDWRCKGTGPSYIKLGAAVRYRCSDVEAWLNSRVTKAEGA